MHYALLVQRRRNHALPAKHVFRAETFVEYQLDAQSSVPRTFLATAAYGDGGPWYIPLKRSFGEGGYEPSVALVSEDSEPAYRRAIEGLLRPNNT